ncbi:MAG: response regulator, partial [Acidobacteriota bacterium]
QQPAIAPVFPPAPVVDHELPPTSILLAEDDPVNRKVTLHMLERLGCPADDVANGREVLSALGRQAYDVILLDVQMPELDGLETARHIRAHWPSPSGPWLIAVTANAIRGDREKCLAAGMDDYVSKPLKSDDLRAALERYRDTVPASPRAARGTPDLAAPPTIEDPVLDTGVLESLRDLDDGDGEILRETVDVFLETTPERLAGLRSALQVDDRESVERLAHTLKSSSGIVGGKRMMAICAELEKSSRSSGLDDASHLVQRIAEQFADLSSELDSVSSG